MADDFVLNVRQIAQYERVAATLPSDRYLLQRNGVGGPYQSIAPTDLISSALELGGFLRLAPNGGGIAWNGAALSFDGTDFNFTDPLKVPGLSSASDIFVAGIALANQDWVQGLFDTQLENSVWTFNGRKGNVQLESQDILRAGGVLQTNPVFAGIVIVPTLWDVRADNDQAASTAWVQRTICHWLMTAPLVRKRLTMT